jgi:hypothetical protein
MYKEKYLKYKTKYLDLKNQLGGDPNIIQDGGNFINDFFSNLSNRIYPKATKKATEKTTKDKVAYENERLAMINERLAMINEITINIAQTLHPDASISKITEAMEFANKKYMETINRNPARQEVNKEYEDAINNGKTMDEAMLKAIDKARIKGDKNELTEWHWFYSLKRQKESNPSFNYLKDKDTFIIWTGWTNDIATATNYMANNSDYLIDEKSGQIRKKNYN